MKNNLPKSIKLKIKEERNRAFLKMSIDDTQDEWNKSYKKYQAYDAMLKPTWKFSPDTILIVAGNLAGILLILNYEKLDIVRSKAISFVLKGRV